jgi:hypothetical protein
MTHDKHAQEMESRGVEGLTEVLRLQAEALARISERMAGLRAKPAESAAPPPAGDPAWAGAGDEGRYLPAMAGDPALKEESLPVLNSFRKFLDQERRRARQRLLWLSLGFTVLIAGVLALVLWMSSQGEKSLRGDLEAARQRLEKNRVAVDEELRAMAAVSARSASELRADVRRNLVLNQTALASNVTSELSGRDEDINRLKEKVSSLEIENAMLAGQLKELARRVKAVEDDTLSYLERPAKAGRFLEAAGLSAGAVSNTAAFPASLDEPLAPLRIESPHFGRSLQLRVPLTP